MLIETRIFVIFYNNRTCKKIMIKYFSIQVSQWHIVIFLFKISRRILMKKRYYVFIPLVENTCICSFILCSNRMCKKIMIKYFNIHILQVTHHNLSLQNLVSRKIFMKKRNISWSYYVYAISWKHVYLFVRILQ